MHLTVYSSFPQLLGQKVSCSMHRCPPQCYGVHRCPSWLACLISLHPFPPISLCISVKFLLSLLAVASRYWLSVAFEELKDIARTDSHGLHLVTGVRLVWIRWRLRTHRYVGIRCFGQMCPLATARRSMGDGRSVRMCRQLMNECPGSSWLDIISIDDPLWLVISTWLWFTVAEGSIAA